MTNSNGTIVKRKATNDSMVSRSRSHGWCSATQMRLTGDLYEPHEDRELITGLVGDVLLTVCFVQRGHRKRIISARKATQREQKDYNEANAPS
jgi:Ribonuclease toxin, BrnT, of type II toxin-antitoxin system